eukprot:CAMPEP_0202869668 /NCGR_PEP_ID=MMETSP1391-20130828/12580_1 /ASSEMBLY_ACC=CAM_ASM_000867 /TAXON_ID=1034604 /ORGANISM="Chlamydomonas leiostraca, Strain SAG 11-49" /LENGTH=548 /DNA_ID=CAMNT_0049550009 /DNA_START=31 /DNA_END=1677 /DNA_ORIENTATION=-
MPRVVAPPKPVAAVMAKRPLVKAAPAPPAVESCPLCIEEMDETDLSFRPCSCGYRVCLFCYEQIKLHCRSQCPGCRREYGKADTETPSDLSRTASDAGDTAGARDRQQATSAASRPSPSTASHAPPPSASTQQQQQQPTRASVKASAPSQAVKRGPDQGGRRNEDSAPGLPSGATWATNRQEAQQASQAPAVADDTAWPSLADSTAQTRRTEEHNHRRSTSVTSSVDHLPSVNSSVDLMSQDPVVSPEQLGLGSQNMLHATSSSSFYPQAQVSTSVFGMSRTVNVPLPNSQGVEPHPETSSLLSSINQAVRNGTLTSKEAAAQLVALLKQKEAQNGKVQSLLAAGKAPPGFASTPGAPAPIAPPPAVSPLGQQQVGLSAQVGGNLLNPLDSPIVPAPPIGRYQPIGKPIAPPGGGLQQDQGQLGGYGQGYNPQGQANGTYSMWNGLPGLSVDLPSSSYNPLATAWQAQSGYGAVGQGVACFAATKAPPPGFGYNPVAGVAAAAGGAVDAAKAPGESRYNPLGVVPSSASARTPPPGMSSYRPTLGAGL